MSGKAGEATGGAKEREAPGSRRVGAAAIRGLIADSFVSLGLPAADAERIAELMTEADLTGVDTHGVFRLPQYVRRLRAGGINPRPHIRATRTAAATALVDGDNGMGHLVMAHAAETAVEIARESGIAWVGVHRSNHAGAAAVYAAMALAHGMIGIYVAVSSANHMPVWGGAEAVLGTNPLAIAIPAGDHPPFVLDMATSVVSFGAIRTHALSGRDLPEGWMVDRADGRPLTDPRRSADGLLLPIGGYKGSGLAIALGLLAGPLNGAAFGRDVVDFSGEVATPCNTGQAMIAIDITRFRPLAAFTAEIDRHLRELGSCRPLPGFDTIRLPGERRWRCREDRVRNGVPLSRPLVRELDRLADALGVPRLAARAG